MKYTQYQKQEYPICSKVTDAAFKVMIKQKLNQSGIKLPSFS